MPDYPGIDGFLGTRGSLMLDLVVVAMMAVIPVLAWSVYLVRYQARYVLHKRVQLTLAAVLGVAVTLFEVDMRLNGWTERAAGSAGGEIPPVVYNVLYVHLVFAVSTTFLWIGVIIHALRIMPCPPGPCPRSPQHAFWGRIAAADMLLTAITGWLFYWLAFVTPR